MKYIIQKLKTYFSKPASESLHTTDVVAYCSICLNHKDELTISSDFKDGHERAMSKIVFLLCSGSLMEEMGDLVNLKCGDNTEMRDSILSEAYALILQNFQEQEESAEAESEDDESPVVDPCKVFSPRNGQEIEEED